MFKTFPVYNILFLKHPCLQHSLFTTFPVYKIPCWQPSPCTTIPVYNIPCLQNSLFTTFPVYNIPCLQYSVLTTFRSNIITCIKQSLFKTIHVCNIPYYNNIFLQYSQFTTSLFTTIPVLNNPCLHMMCVACHVTCWGSWTFSQNLKYLAHMVWEWRCFEDILKVVWHDILLFWNMLLINAYEGAFRKALATPSLLKKSEFKMGHLRSRNSKRVSVYQRYRPM